MDDFDNALGAEIKTRSQLMRDEWVIPFPEVVDAIDQASGAGIAVLGVEVLELLADGLRTDAMSAYDFREGNEWIVFVAENNDAAKQFVTRNARPSGYGYILTVASQRELREARKLNS